MALVYIGLGSNVGDRKAFIQKALESLRVFSNVRRVSTLIETAPHGVAYIEPKFMNGVVEVETKLPPHEVLKELMRIELELGRKRSEVGAPREIDLDILSYDSQVMESIELTLPHARMHLRRFVMQPLVELNPAWIHPVLKRTSSEILSALD